MSWTCCLQVHGIEPFQRDSLNQPWELHVYPTDDWYAKARIAVDRCDTELSQHITGGDKGLADEVRRRQHSGL
jgi:hypothetical protein